LTLTREQLSERSVKGHVTRKLRLSGNEFDNYKQLSESVENMRDSKSLSSIKEMYQNMGMTSKAVELITKNYKDDDKDDIIDDYDEDVDDTEFQQVFLINNNANIPAGTWVAYKPMYSWVKNQAFVKEVLEKNWTQYRDKKRGISYTKRGREVSKDRKSVDEFGNIEWKRNEKKDPVKMKTKDEFRDGFLKNVTYAIIQTIHKKGSKQKYMTYTDKETGKLVKVQHFNGAEHWMKPEYKELYKDVYDNGYREV
jgi:hypothetical protein